MQLNITSLERFYGKQCSFLINCANFVCFCIAWLTQLAGDKNFSKMRVLCCNFNGLPCLCFILEAPISFLFFEWGFFQSRKTVFLQSAQLCTERFVLYGGFSFKWSASFNRKFTHSCQNSTKFNGQPQNCRKNVFHQPH